MAVVNLLDQMTSLLQLELDAAEDETDQVNGILDRSEPENPLDSLRESHLPCLDLLLTENILSHVLATSRMPVSGKITITSQSKCVQGLKNSPMLEPSELNVPFCFASRSILFVLTNYVCNNC